MNENYESLWIQISGWMLGGIFARGAAYILLFVGLYLIIRRQRLLLGISCLGLSGLIAISSTLFNLQL
jgi:O-antigen ligase